MKKPSNPSAAGEPEVVEGGSKNCSNLCRVVVSFVMEYGTWKVKSAIKDREERGKGGKETHEVKNGWGGLSI